MGNRIIETSDHHPIDLKITDYYGPNDRTLAFYSWNFTHLYQSIKLNSFYFSQSTTEAINISTIMHELMHSVHIDDMYNDPAEDWINQMTAGEKDFTSFGPCDLKVYYQYIWDI